MSNQMKIKDCIREGYLHYSHASSSKIREKRYE